MSCGHAHVVFVARARLFHQPNSATISAFCSPSVCEVPRASRRPSVRDHLLCVACRGIRQPRSTRARGRVSGRSPSCPPIQRWSRRVDGGLRPRATWHRRCVASPTPPATPLAPPAGRKARSSASRLHPPRPGTATHVPQHTPQQGCSAPITPPRTPSLPKAGRPSAERRGPTRERRFLPPG